MILKWFDSRRAVEIGGQLADQIARKAGAVPSMRTMGTPPKLPAKMIKDLFEAADRDVRALTLNFYQRAKFANAFKWRLLESGMDRAKADDITQSLLLHISLNRDGFLPGSRPAVANSGPKSNNVHRLLARGNACLAQGAYADAIACYQDVVSIDPLHADALNKLGAALVKLGRYSEAEERFRQSIRVMPNFPDPHSNLGSTLRWMGNVVDSEISLRHAIKLNPKHAEARVSLGLTLILLGRERDAKAHFKKVLKAAPRNADALLGMVLLSNIDGQFDEAIVLLKRVLAVNPAMPAARALLAGMRKMTRSDSDWLESAEKILARPIAPMEAAELRFAIGKYYDDVEDYAAAFQSYKCANDLLKNIAVGYQRDARKAFVDDLIGAYSRSEIARMTDRGSDSMKPVFVVGMLRSGTSLVEQIISSHPSAKGAGELEFWSDAVHKHGAAIRRGILDRSTRKNLADDYLSTLTSRYGDALRIVDKAPINADYLGVIYSVFPNARVIYMRRDPIDACLSCYFQKFSLGLNFTFDLADLAHYYREHRRLMTHWRAVLPPGTILDVPYDELVADQNLWTRRILDSIGLEWDQRCFNFHTTKRPVATASSWQVRQPIYTSSVRRWRNYEKYVGPLLELRDLDSR